MTKATLASLRDQAVRRLIAESINSFMKGERTRRCAYCGTSFKPESRFHFFDGPDCRRNFYGGIFRPKVPKD